MLRKSPVVEKKTVIVESKDGKTTNRCTPTRADSIVKRRYGFWLDPNRIKLRYTKEDKKMMRKKVIQFDNRKCYICNIEIPEDDFPTIDHVIPKKNNIGAERINNMRCCCKRCNNDKASMTLSQYVDLIERKKRKYSYISSNQLKKLKVIVNNYS